MLTRARSRALSTPSDSSLSSALASSETRIEVSTIAEASSSTSSDEFFLRRLHQHLCVSCGVASHQKAWDPENHWPRIGPPLPVVMCIAWRGHIQLMRTSYEHIFGLLMNALEITSFVLKGAKVTTAMAVLWIQHFTCLQSVWCRQAETSWRSTEWKFSHSVTWWQLL